jgi:uncharacterized protein involved in high-affinity Fe2+ transport
MKLLKRSHRILGLLTALASAALIAACGSSVGLTTSTSAGDSGAMSAMTTTSAASDGGMAMGGGGMATGPRTAGSTDPGHAGPNTLKVDGITPIPTQKLLTADWQHMKISAMAMTAVPFVIFNGTREQTAKIPHDVSFHLMVTLNDDRTNTPIPYASVWATISRNGKTVYDERQWPMLAEYLGPHYGNNVALPGAGHYRLTLLISPPASARHIEYKGIWLQPHRVTANFNWTPPRT